MIEAQQSVLSPASDFSAARNSFLFFLAVLLFLPSVTFSLLPAEIFPWGLVFALFFGSRIDAKILLAALYLLGITLIGQIATHEPNIGESLRSLGAYLNCILVFGVLVSMPRTDIQRVASACRILFVVLVVLGIVQLSGVATFLDASLKLLVPRFSSTALEFMGGRGVSLLSSEPARAGIELVSIYLVVRFGIKSRKMQIIGDFCLGLFLLLVIKSAQSLAFYFVFLGIFHNIRLIKVVPFFLVGIVLLARAWEFDGRVVVLIKDIYEQSSLRDVLYLVSNTSGHRITSIISNYQYGFYHPFGGGIGNWMTSSVVALDQSGVDLSKLNYFRLYGAGYAVPIRGSGFATNLILDAGIVGIVPVLYAIHSSIRRIGGFSRAALSVTFLFLAKIAFFGSVGNPVVWASTVLCIRSIEWPSQSGETNTERQVVKGR